MDLSLLRDWLLEHGPLVGMMAGTTEDIDICWPQKAGGDPYPDFVFWFSRRAEPLQNGQRRISFNANSQSRAPIEPSLYYYPFAVPEWLWRGWSQLPPNVFADALLELETPLPDELQLIVQNTRWE